MHTDRATLSSNYMMKSECFCLKNVDQQWCLQHEASWCSQGIILLSQMKDKYDLIVFRMKKHYFESVWFLQACWAMLFSNLWHMITFFSETGVQKERKSGQVAAAIYFYGFGLVLWVLCQTVAVCYSITPVVLCKHTPATVSVLFQSAKWCRLYLQAGKVQALPARILAFSSLIHYERRYSQISDDS